MKLFCYFKLLNCFSLHILMNVYLFLYLLLVVQYMLVQTFLYFLHKKYCSQTFF